jgi:monoamine oxidase
MRDNPLAAPADWLDAKHAKLDVSMHAWMRAKGLSDSVVKIGYELNPSFGSDADDVSALLMLFRAAFSKAQRRHAAADGVGFTAEHGVDRIPQAMAGALRTEVMLERRVVAITQTRDSVRVACADGGSATAKRVVCSVPFGVLRHITLDPPLAGLQSEAVAELRSQPITQVYVAPRRPFWEDDGYAPSLYTDALPGMVAAVRSGADPGTITHLTAWVMGKHALALDALDASEAGRRVIAAIEELRPAARGQLELLGLHSWGADACAAGAWAYFRPGQIRRFAAAMPVPHGRVHFCGEHLATASRGMEAAMETAERAARELLGHI